MSGLSRRDFIVIGAGVVATGASSFSAAASTTGATETYGLSAFGDLGYPANFKHLKYVNPDAPKGGVFSQLAGAGTATFNSLNGFILKGDAAQDMELVFASLMARANDEPDAIYGLAADQVSISPDRQTYRFRLREGIKFHDGTPITAADVAFSLTTLKEKGHPNIAMLLREMEAAEADGDRVAVIRFSAKRSHDTPLIVARLPILSSAFYATRKFDETSLEPPLGSGPYKVGRFEQGRFLEFERVKDWWGTDLPVMRGQNNFDVLRYDYYRERETAFEGFSAKSYAFREEFTSRVWATRYDFPAIRDGRVKRETIPDDRPSGAQGWMINARRERFADRRLREAFALAFDFEWANQNLMFGSYARTHSYFQNSDMMARGMPSPAELALLEPYRGKVDAEVFGEPWVPPVSNGSGQDRQLLRRASELLTAAGWSIKDGKRDQCERRTADGRVPAVRAGVRTAPRALSEEPHGARHRRQRAPCRTRTVPCPHSGVRFRHRRQSHRAARHPRRCAAQLLLEPRRLCQGISEFLRHRRSRRRRTDRARHCGERSRQPQQRVPRTRPCIARRPLLGATLVQAVALDRLLGHVRQARHEAALCARHS